jgi:hypothetical protein
MYTFDLDIEKSVPLFSVHRELIRYTSLESITRFQWFYSFLYYSCNIQSA